MIGLFLFIITQSPTPHYHWAVFGGYSSGPVYRPEREDEGTEANTGRREMRKKSRVDKKRIVRLLLLLHAIKVLVCQH
jgi:hypothetical protein